MKAYYFSRKKIKDKIQLISQYKNRCNALRVRRGRGMHKEGKEMERERERRRENQKDLKKAEREKGERGNEDE